MIGGESFFKVYQEILDICLVEHLTFTKEDVDDMPPFERTNYIEMIREHLNKIAEEKEKAMKHRERKT